jgi:hypothetical protein
MACNINSRKKLLNNDAYKRNEGSPKIVIWTRIRLIRYEHVLTDSKSCLMVWILWVSNQSLNEYRATHSYPSSAPPHMDDRNMLGPKLGSWAGWFIRSHLKILPWMAADEWDVILFFRRSLFRSRLGDCLSRVRSMWFFLVSSGML